MTYKEAKKFRPGDKIGFYGGPGELTNGPEKLPILAINDNTAIKPPVIEITVNSPSFGLITRPHRQFQRPGIPILDCPTWDEILKDLGVVD